MSKKFFLIILLFIFSHSFFSNDLLTNESTDINRFNFNFNFDDLSRSFIKENNNNTLESISEFLTNYDYFFLVLLPISGYSAGYLLNDDKLKKVATDSILSSALTGSIIITTKIFVGRERPNPENDTYSFKPFAPLTEGSTYTSFPSGHSAVSWAAYTPYAMQYNPWIFSIPFSISLSRLIEDRHWLSDVVVGSLIGYYVASYMYYR